MKTINPNVHVFNTLEGATSLFANSRPARLLTIRKPTGKRDFFVDVTPEPSEQLHVVWPEMYIVIKTNEPH